LRSLPRVLDVVPDVDPVVPRVVVDPVAPVAPLLFPAVDEPVVVRPLFAGG
jgi:hypothetical protein